MSKEKRLVPELRFPEFDGEWEKSNIGLVANVFSGGTPDTENSAYWNGDINWFTPTEIGSNKYVFESKRRITELGLTKSSAKMLEKGTILLTTRATIGDVSIFSGNICSTNQGFQ